MSDTTLTRPALTGRASLARLMARHTAVERYLQHAQRRAADCGNTFHGRVWAGIAADYRAELQTLAQLIARKQQRQRATAAA